MPGTPHPASPQAQLTHTVQLHVTDDETFGAEHALGSRHDLTVLDAARPGAQVHLTGLGGGGRQVQVTVTFTLTPDGPVQVSSEAHLLIREPGQPVREQGGAAFGGRVAAGHTDSD